MSSAQNKLGPLLEINRAIRENRTADYPSHNLSLGMRPIGFGPGNSRWTWSEQPLDVMNPFGFLHGGYLAVFVDEIMSTAIASVLGDREWAVTAETKINYLRALRPGPLEGSGKVVRRTRTLAFLKAEIRTADGELGVTSTSTWSVSSL